MDSESNDDNILIETKKSFDDCFNKLIEKFKETKEQTYIPFNYKENNILLEYNKKLLSLQEELSKVSKENKNLLKTINELKLNKAEINEIKTNTMKILEILTHDNNKDKEVQEQSNTDKQIELKKLKLELHIENIHNSSYFFTPIILHDGRIVGCGVDCKSISVCSVNYLTKEWKIDINKADAHDSNIRSFLELTDDRLISSSDDGSIKVWKVRQNDLIEIKNINEHRGKVTKVLQIDKDKFASSSHDETIKIWNTANPYQLTQTLICEAQVMNMIYINANDTLISSCGSSCLEFWKIKANQKVKSIKGVYTEYCLNSMIELPNHNIAISTVSPSSTIVIIDTQQFTIIQQIQLQGYISNYSAICLLNKNSFLYIREGNLVQISTTDYSILYSTKNKTNLQGMFGLLSVPEENCIIVHNNKNGIDILKANYI